MYSAELVSNAYTNDVWFEQNSESVFTFGFPDFLEVDFCDNQSDLTRARDSSSGSGNVVRRSARLSGRDFNTDNDSD